MKEEITGFSLFLLCHYFGRRARAMLHSLACQSGCPAPLQLFVFHARKEDADLVLEGAASGPNRPLIHLLEIPSDGIMQRAVHFSKAQEMHDFSHTVFCDADLWFPPTFWSAYTQALGEEPPGYWSSKVLNVPWPRSETVLEEWSEIRCEHLEQSSTGPHREEYFGRVGHFQCIPRTLATYPANPRFGVESSDLLFSSLAITRSASLQVERRISRSLIYHLDHPFSWEGTGGVQL